MIPVTISQQLIIGVGQDLLEESPAMLEKLVDLKDRKRRSFARNLYNMGLHFNANHGDFSKLIDFLQNGALRIDECVKDSSYAHKCIDLYFLGFRIGFPRMAIAA